MSKQENRLVSSQWIDCHGPPGEIGQLAGLLDFVEARTCRAVAAWLRTLAKPGTQPADYYEEAARQLSDGEIPRTTHPTGGK